MHWLFEFSEDDSALDGFSANTFHGQIHAKQDRSNLPTMRQDRSHLPPLQAHRSSPRTLQRWSLY